MSNHDGMTYEEIARKYDITASKAQTIVKSSFNKMVKGLVEKEDIDIFSAVLALREYFNMEYCDAVEKLNEENRDMLKKYAADNYNIKKDSTDDTGLMSLFE
jgi:DNA-binding transcriptional regulator LsrR (DeoR family)